MVHILNGILNVAMMFSLVQRRAILLFLTPFDEGVDGICIFYEDEDAYYDGKTIEFYLF